jgi:hypothetical protein
MPSEEVTKMAAKGLTEERQSATPPKIANRKCTGKQKCISLA